MADDRRHQPPGRDFDDLADLTRTRVARLGNGFGELVASFARACGPELARVAHPVLLKDGTLKLRCSSSSWAQAVRFQEREIIERLRVEVPQLPVERIHAVAGAPVAGDDTTPPPRTRLEPATPQLDTRLDQLVADIADPALRAKVRAAASAATRRGRMADNP